MILASGARGLGFNSRSSPMHVLGRRGNALTLSNHCSHDCQLHAITRLALLVALAVDPGGSLDSHRGHCRRLRGHNSVAGNRNRVARVKAEYRDQLDCTGFHSRHQRPEGPKPKQGLPRKMDSGGSDWNAGAGGRTPIPQSPIPQPSSSILFLAWLPATRHHFRT